MGADLGPGVLGELSGDGRCGICVQIPNYRELNLQERLIESVSLLVVSTHALSPAGD